MPVLPLFNAPRSAEDLVKYAWFNADHHIQVTNAIQRTKGLNIETQIIYPLPPPDDMGGWFLSHQSWHSQINSVLGTTGNNLLSVDFNDPAAVRAWAFLHATEHLAWQKATGIA